MTASNLDAGSAIVLKNRDDPSLGMGYWDATGTSANGTKVTRRCTVNFARHPTQPDLIRVFTAKHCNFSPESSEFASAVSTFHLWANGGYFSVPVEFELRKEFAAFAAAGAPLLQAFGGESGFDKWSRETGVGAAAECKTETAANMSRLTAGQRLACASTSDLVNLDARVIVPEKYKSLYAQVLEVVSKRNENISGAPARDRELFNAVQNSINIQANLPTTLQEMAYLFNSNFCAAPVGHPVTFRKAGKALERHGWCSNALLRESIVAAIKAKIPELLFDTYMKDTIEMPFDGDYSPTSKIVALHKKLWVCSISSLDEVQTDKVTSFNGCDRAKFTELMWRRWLLESDARLAEISPENRNKFGFNAETYLTLGVNALPTKAALTASDLSKSVAKIFTLPREDRYLLGLPGKQIFLFSFSPDAEKMYFTKKDSGSLLSILGTVPISALSAIDGAETSGGAAITPLPKIEDEEVIPSGKNKRGC